MEGSLHRDRDRDRDRSHLGSSLLDPSGRFGDTQAPTVFSRRHDFDFEDVFGGPPKSTLVYERRGSIDGTMWDLSIARDSLGGEKFDFLGECSSPCSTRRKDAEDDFLSDIFRGSENSACSTPRIGLECDSISTNRVISPVDSLLPRTESCVGSSSLSSKLCLLKKMAEERDDDLYSSSKNADSYLDAKHLAEVQSELKSNKPNALFHPSSLSSHNSCQKYSSGSKVKVGQFHFSMYKWASKGVMLAAPSTSKESCRYNGRLRGLPVPFIQGPDIPSNNKITPNSHHIESGIQDNILSTEPYAQEIFSMDSAIMADIVHGPENKDNKLDEDREDFLNYSSPTGSAEGPVDFKKNNINRSIGDQTMAQGVPVELEENIQFSKVRGKVKNFIKKFNEDLSQSQSGKPKYIRKAKVKEDIKTQRTKDYVENIYNIDGDSVAQVDSPAHQFEQVFKEERVQSDVNFNVRNEFKSFDEGRRSLMQSFESEVPYNVTEVIHYEVEEFMVEELEGHNETLQVESDFKKIQKSDAKIQKWSSGKQGNIRSMLSTLQDVLWERSGWKPVALVDIIETSSVKRIYQKALLQLHPDKLQQRGALTEQKYIAEKVYSILQEAWDHFNTLSAL